MPLFSFCWGRGLDSSFEHSNHLLNIISITEFSKFGNIYGKLEKTGDGTVQKGELPFLLFSKETGLNWKTTRSLWRQGQIWVFPNTPLSVWSCQHNKWNCTTECCIAIVTIESPLRTSKYTGLSTTTEMIYWRKNHVSGQYLPLKCSWEMLNSVISDKITFFTGTEDLKWKKSPKHQGISFLICMYHKKGELGSKVYGLARCLPP